MQRLVYCSTSDIIEIKLIEQLLLQAQTNNEKVCISGVLFYNNKYFLQAIEGPSDKINELYHKIAKDERHWNLNLLLYNSIDKRAFSEWNMGMATQRKENNRSFFKFGMNEGFNPYLLTSNNCLEFILSLQVTAKSL